MSISAPRISAFIISTFCLTPTEISSIFARGSMSKLYFSHIARVSSTALSLSKRIPFLGSMPSITFSAMVREGTRTKCWYTMPIPISIALRGDVSFTSSPLMIMRPWLGCSTPKSNFIRVDLPAPFSPQMACISPFSAEKHTLSLAITPLSYTFVMFSITRKSFICRSPFVYLKRNSGRQHIV